MTKTTSGKRYSNRPFPRYCYLPGNGLPHPKTDPKGHSYGEEEEYLPSFSPADWQSCDIYLYGVDLFNAGYYWEAHEAFETLWLAAGQRATPCGRYLQGMIQLSASLLKRYCGENEAAYSLTRSARDSFAAAEHCYLGFSISRLLEESIRMLDENREEFPTIDLDRR